MKSWHVLKKDGAQYSQSEEFGLSLIKKQHQNILSVGISTAGFAELRMALDDDRRKIIATTLDGHGLEFTRNIIQQYSVNDKVELRIEDVSGDLDYKPASFDFVYARLVLHYLEKEKLQKALQNLYRILRPAGEMYVVVNPSSG